MKDFEHYLGIANHDIQMANNHNALKSYVASLLCNYDDLVEENQQLKNWKELHSSSALAEENIKIWKTVEKLRNQQKEFIKYLKDEIKRLEEVQVTSLEEITGKDYLIKVEKEILSKYKEIIGDVEDE